MYIKHPFTDVTKMGKRRKKWKFLRDAWIVGNTYMSGLPYAPQLFDADMTEYVPSICGDHHCNYVYSISSIQALPRIEKEGAPHVEGKTVIHVIG